jgi:hypothetical protein
VKAGTEDVFFNTLVPSTHSSERMERGARVALTQARREELACGMGRAMSARGRGGQLGEAVATEGVRSAAAPMGSGTHYCLDLSSPKDELKYYESRKSYSGAPPWDMMYPLRKYERW